VVSEKGQVTIPKRLRDRLGIRAGTVLEFREERAELVATKSLAEDPVEAAYGVLRSRTPTDAMINDLRGEPDAV
jgi:AbrB family looped-hinge helix DNA binding protein